MSENAEIAFMRLNALAAKGYRLERLPLAPPADSAELYHAENPEHPFYKSGTDKPRLVLLGDGTLLIGLDHLDEKRHSRIEPDASAAFQNYLAKIPPVTSWGLLKTTASRLIMRVTVWGLMLVLGLAIAWAAATMLHLIGVKF